MLKINNLTATVDNKTILDGLNLNIEDGEIHIIMGKNGIGKSSLCKIIMNDSNYDVKGGSVLFNNKNLREMSTSEIAGEKIMLINQNPISIEGVTNAELLRTALRESGTNKVNIFEFNKKMEQACKALSLDEKFIHKEINVGASGGERKKIELLHAAILEPKFLMLDEIDSGLDVDALKVVTKFINDYHNLTGCSILIITHHPDIIKYIKPNYVHVLDNGRIVKTGDHHLVYEIENNGFEANAITEDDENE